MLSRKFHSSMLRSYKGKPDDALQGASMFIILKWSHSLETGFLKGSIFFQVYSTSPLYFALTCILRLLNSLSISLRAFESCWSNRVQFDILSSGIFKQFFNPYFRIFEQIFFRCYRMFEQFLFR